MVKRYREKETRNSTLVCTSLYKEAPAPSGLVKKSEKSALQLIVREQLDRVDSPENRFKRAWNQEHGSRKIGSSAPGTTCSPDTQNGNMTVQHERGKLLWSSTSRPK